VVHEITQKLAILKTSLNDLLYEIGKGVDHKILHTQALEILLYLDKIQEAAGVKKKEVSADDIISQEAKKVGSRLKLWSRRQSQINSRILNCFIELTQETGGPVSVHELKARAERKGIDKFDSNFIQMREISSKNHGKIFDLTDGLVSIWEPVASLVDTYKQDVGQRHF
jgi:hypothetical protein